MACRANGRLSAPPEIDMKLGTLLFVAALAAAASPLAAQQPNVQQQPSAQPPIATQPSATQSTVAAPAEQPVATPVAAPTAPLPGPRVRAEFRPAQARIPAGRTTAFQEGENHTITVSTLALVLGVVILVLLVVR
jgi:hypothetical protein